MSGLCCACAHPIHDAATQKVRTTASTRKKTLEYLCSSDTVCSTYVEGAYACLKGSTFSQCGRPLADQREPIRPPDAGLSTEWSCCLFSRPGVQYTAPFVRRAGALAAQNVSFVSAIDTCSKGENILRHY